MVTMPVAVTVAVTVPVPVAIVVPLSVVLGSGPKLLRSKTTGSSFYNLSSAHQYTRCSTQYSPTNPIFEIARLPRGINVNPYVGDAAFKLFTSGQTRGKAPGRRRRKISHSKNDATVKDIGVRAGGENRG